MTADYARETRRDRITEQWVAFAPTRRFRPNNTGSLGPRAAQNAQRDAECPFCPGHEEALPTVWWQLESTNSRPWRTRAVPNKYPAYTPDAPRVFQPNGLYEARRSYGRQEIIIDTPHHHESLATMPRSQIEALVQTYHTRYQTCREDEPELYPAVFRNQGAAAGASIAHPHSQLIATKTPLPRIQHEERQAQIRYRELGTCPYCVVIEEEVEADQRVVYTTDHFVVFVPYAARVPFELWILPRAHSPEFGRSSSKTRARLAGVLQESVRRLHECLQDPNYNLFLRTALEHNTDAPHLHWSLRLQPRLTVQAGFELSTGIRINPSIPERDAAMLRDSD